MTEAELAWLAGLLEGEGSFLLAYSRFNGKRYTYARISVQMADRDVIERVASLTKTKCKIFTDKVRATEKIRASKPLHRAWVNGAAAVELMVQLRPWMGQRRQIRIDEVLAEHRKAASTESQLRKQRLSASSKAQALFAALSPEQKSARMRIAAEARWGKSALTGLPPRFPL